MIKDDKIILYENILASMNDGLIAISSDGEMFMINPAAEKILEYSREQLEGKGWGEVFFLQGGNEEFNQVILDVIYERKIKYSRIVPYCTPSG
ncbi:MAG: PAS domain-containing sensor histidine kinase, partial [Deltaproteobacteria bacterium]